MKRALFTLIVSGSLFMSATNTSAEEGFAEEGWFAGAGLGRSENRDYECDGCVMPIFTLDDTGSAWKVYGGYQFNKHIAVQGGYIKLADTDATGDQWTDKLEVDGIFGAIQGILPLSDAFDLFATVGLFHWDQDVTYNGLSGKFDGTDPFYSLGASYSFDKPGVKVQLEWARFKNVGNDDPFFKHIDDYDVITLNGVYQF